jgi:Limiting CO2-inducible proteins B/C beta carbonyic anhydrases
MKIGQAFPGALTNTDLLARVSSRLSKRGFHQNNTLVASSLCSDEVNRPLEETFYKYYGNSYFSMGGLAGFPFSGLTGFGAMASHIPDDGNCLLVYGPHVGVDSSGNVGKVDRIGKSQSGTCCGSAVYASKYLNTVLSGEAEAMPLPSSAFDAQQTFVTNMLLPYASEIQDSKEPMVAIPFLAYKPIDNMMTRIVAKASTKVGKGRIAMLGGLQVC